jgi:uncharacterized protein YdhG (YjbR/CyaY superfamily)
VKKNTAKTVDAYLAALAPDKRRALTKLRAQIRAAAPQATETISYGMPAYKMNGRPVVYFGAAAHHCSLYAVPDRDRSGALRAELARYDTSGKGTLRFTPEKPLPAALVTKLVKERIRGLSSAR